MQRLPVKSSNVISVGYDEAQEILEVEFKGGSVYQYFSVPIEVYTGMITASSVGSFLATEVKGSYEYRRVS